jgi:hypothetical protein
MSFFAIAASQMEHHITVQCIPKQFSWLNEAVLLISSSCKQLIFYTNFVL